MTRFWNCDVLSQKQASDSPDQSRRSPCVVSAGFEWEIIRSRILSCRESLQTQQVAAYTCCSLTHLFFFFFYSAAIGCIEMCCVCVWTEKRLFVADDCGAFVSAVSSLLIEWGTLGFDLDTGSASHGWIERRRGVEWWKRWRAEKADYADSGGGGWSIRLEHSPVAVTAKQERSESKWEAKCNSIN